MPDIALDPALSVYALVRRTLNQRTLVNHRRTMLIISHEIENVILLDKVRARLFSGFQRMSAFLPQVERYQRLAEQAESIYVFGVMDVTPPPIMRVTYVPLRPTDQLAREWFIVADAPEYFTTLATEEISPAGVQDMERRFEGIWSFDEDMVLILRDWLSSLVDAQPVSATDRDYARQIKTMSRTIGRLTGRITRALEQPDAAAQELQTVMTAQVEPEAERMAGKLGT